MGLIHAFPGNNGHHVAPMIRWLTADAHAHIFSGREQKFLIADHPPDAGASVQQDERIRWIGTGRRAALEFTRQVRSDDHLILHSFQGPHLPYALTWRRALLRRTAWIIWGADVRSRMAGLERRPPSSYSLMWRECVRHMRCVGALAHGDYDVLESLRPMVLPTNVPFFYGIATASPLPVHMHAPKPPTRNRVILVGNSGAQTNNHAEALHWLQAAGATADVVCPMGYGGTPEYVASIAGLGMRLFGERFKPILQQLSPQEFDRLLYSADVLVFNHERQQGLFSLTRMLDLGRKVYVRGDTSLYRMLVSQGFCVFDSLGIPEGDSDALLAPLSPAQILSNKDAIQRHRSPRAAEDAWTRLLTALYEDHPRDVGRSNELSP